MARAENLGARGGEAAKRRRRRRRRREAAGRRSIREQGRGALRSGPHVPPPAPPGCRGAGPGGRSQASRESQAIHCPRTALLSVPALRGPLLGTVASAPCTARWKSRSWGMGFRGGLSPPGWPAERPPRNHPRTPGSPEEGGGCGVGTPLGMGNQGERSDKNKDMKSQGRDQGDVSGMSSRKVMGVGQGQAWLCQRMARGGNPPPSHPSSDDEKGRSREAPRETRAHLEAPSRTMAQVRSPWKRWREKKQKSGRHSEDGENERGLEGRLCRGGRARRGGNVKVARRSRRRGARRRRASSGGRQEGKDGGRGAGGQDVSERAPRVHRAVTADPGAHGRHGDRKGVNAQAGSPGCCVSQQA